MMQEPVWYTRVRPHPDYDNQRIILIDSNVVIELTNRKAWDREAEFVMNCPPAMLRIKINAQVWRELMGDRAQGGGMPPAALAAQREFVDAYRRFGKIFIDDGQVPFFRSGRLALFHALDAAIAATGNLSIPDRAVMADAIVNRIPLLTRERRAREGLAKALNNGRVKALLKANGLPQTLAEISLRD